MSERVTVYQVAYIPDNPETQHLYVNDCRFLLISEALAHLRWWRESKGPNAAGRYGLIELEFTFLEVPLQEKPLTEFGEKLMGKPGSFPHFPWSPEAEP